MSGVFDPDVKLAALAFVLPLSMVLVCFTGLILFGMSRGQREVDLTDAFERGRCVGWADAAGMIPAWDEDGNCVIGEYPTMERE